MKIVLAVIAASLLTPAAALAVDYPPAKDPGKLPPPHPNGKEATLHVCKKPRCAFHTIQQAVNASRGGDKVKVANGTYKEAVQVKNKGRNGLVIVGNAKKPGKVVLDGKSLKGGKAQNAFFVNAVNHVTIKGFKAKNYKANGFFVTNATGYLFTHLIAEKTGAYGLYAFNTKGGTMSNSEAYYMNDAGFYVGQTPKQVKPRRTYVKNVLGHTNVIGFSGTNMRYVTIQGSKFWNNGVGIAPNALDSEKYPPEEFNVIVDNDIFWNNFNFYLGAPFKQAPTAVGDLAYPPGVGIILFGGRDNTVEGNRLYGNYISGIAMIDQILLDPDVGTLDRNHVLANDFGLGGTDLNGRDIAYDGSGSGNCFEGVENTQNNIPADNSELVACPFDGSNGVNEDAHNEMIAISTDSDHEKYWIKHPHAPKAGYNPLEHWTKSFDGGSAAGKARVGAAVATAAGTRTVKVGDYFLSPSRMTVSRGTRVVWKWLASNGDTHDVKLKRGPRGVTHFHSDYASTGYSFARRLRKPGKYVVICTLHPTKMHQTITVK
jgi:plastocyanin